MIKAFLKENPTPPRLRPEGAPLFPKASRIVQDSGKVSTLSLQFTNILASVGLREPVKHKSTGKGRAAERDVASVSFHGLRHTAVARDSASGTSQPSCRTGTSGRTGPATWRIASSGIGRGTASKTIARVPWALLSVKNVPLCAISREILLVKFF
jgi:hypothetical protein